MKGVLSADNVSQILSADNVSQKCQPRHHITKQEYVCKCGAKADVWDSWDMYCAVCYLQKQKALDR